MSFLKKNMKPSLAKPLIIAVLIIVAIVAVIVFFGTKQKLDTAKTSSDQNGEALAINETGLDGDDEVENVADVEKVIAKWVEANPQAIIQAVANMQQKAMKQRVDEAGQSIKTKGDELYSKSSPSHAPAGYNVTVVEFFDYNCGYCKKAGQVVEQLLKEDKKVRVIYKDFPILGEASYELAKVSVAVNMVEPSLYREFHNALMKSNERNKQGAIKVAKSVGINQEKLEKTLSSKAEEINNLLQSNLSLGSGIGINGTPGFVIGEELIPGAIELEAFREKVAALRAK